MFNGYGPCGDGRHRVERFGNDDGAAVLATEGRSEDVAGLQSDWEFIAHARLDIPALVAEIERLRAEVSSPASPLENNDLGLSIDMLDVDRLRKWARLLLVHGADISHWGSVPFVAGKMQIMATEMERAIKDIGTLRRLVQR